MASSTRVAAKPAQPPLHVANFASQGRSWTLSVALAAVLALDWFLSLRGALSYALTAAATVLVGAEQATVEVALELSG